MTYSYKNIARPHLRPQSFVPSNIRSTLFNHCIPFSLLLIPPLQIIHFPHLHPFHPQYRIRRHNVEVKIRHRELQQVIRRRELVVVYDNLLLLLSLHIVLFHALQYIDGGSDPDLEFFEGGFGVGHGDGLEAGDADGGAFGGVRDALDLVGEALHGGVKASGEEFGGRSGGGAAGFGEDVGEVFEAADEGRDGELVECDRHFDGSGGDDGGGRCRFGGRKGMGNKLLDS